MIYFLSNYIYNACFCLDIPHVAKDKDIIKYTFYDKVNGLTALVGQISKRIMGTIL